jgi:hypothetical protein
MVKVMVVSRVTAIKSAVKKKEYLLLIFTIDNQHIGLGAKYNRCQRGAPSIFLSITFRVGDVFAGSVQISICIVSFGGR